MAFTDIITRLSPTKLRSFHEDGFVTLGKFIATEEIERAQKDLDDLLAKIELVDSYNLRCHRQDDVLQQENRLKCCEPVIDLSATCRRLALADGTFATLNALLGESASLFKDKIMFLLPGFKGSSIYQDFVPEESFPTFVTVLIAIDSLDEKSGRLEIFPTVKTSSTADTIQSVYLNLNAGDIVVFKGFMPYRLSANQSSTPRRLLSLGYNPMSTGDEKRDHYYHEFHDWLGKRFEEHGRAPVYFR